MALIAPAQAASAAVGAATTADRVTPGAAALRAPMALPASGGQGGIVNAAPTACPRGYFCFWDAAGFTGRMGKLQDCYGQSLATWNWQYRVVSAYYNLDSGSVQFRYATFSLFQIGAGNRSMADAGVYAGLATNVYRYC
ncbi:peptidase inhibitor family I36 protein [Dactylosporangium matsuzakiense]|uniref:peptidase inhibitor family I36 protein n=1 Tax=Dactylosporangium matsuzakiense TaxID=53360 RepID=UPI0022F31D78|nr:peptidase inhibitor family I36 protein [Dactylosporangium matsuzakiense]